VKQYIAFVRYLDPFRSLFGRIFLWFWLTTILLILSSALINRQLNDHFQLNTAEPEQVDTLKRIANRLEKMSDRFRIAGGSMKRIIRSPRLAEDHTIALYHTETRSWLINRPLPPRVRKHNLLPLIVAGEISQIATPTHIFFGTQTIAVGQKTYLLLAAKRKPIQTPIERFYAQQLWVRILILTLVSGLLCFALAVSLVKPIHKLRNASRQLASGNTQVQIQGVEKRGDELGQLSRDFNSMADRIDQLLAAQKRLIGDISYELRTPMTRLQLAIGLADVTGTDLPKHLQRIEKEAERIDQMIEQLLQLSRLESHARFLDKESISINLLLETLVEEAELEARSLNKSIQLNLTEDLTINADLRLITSAIENLLRNAIHYADTQVKMSLEKNDDKLHLKVSDDGKGVPENELKNLFQPFYRASTSRERKTGGTGLGLAIAERAVKAHQGSIYASNLDNGGLMIEVIVELVNTH
jgi:two-component system sensor histidine kinase CpxA